MRTVKFHVSALLHKFGVDGRAGLVKKAAYEFTQGPDSGAESGREAAAERDRAAMPDLQVAELKVLRLTGFDRRSR